jgi:hypothetical protein
MLATDRQSERMKQNSSLFEGVFVKHTVTALRVICAMAGEGEPTGLLLVRRNQ